MGYREVFDPPRPAREAIPSWYQRLPSYGPGGKSVGDSGHYNSTAKHCMPILDSMTAGYVLELPQDLHVLSNTPEDVETSWPVGDFGPLVESHPSWQLATYRFESGWSPHALKLINHWQIITPRGYSTLFLPPMWQNESRFQVFPGLVDTDVYPQAINFPFMVQRGFEGTIEAGTPFVQLIPVRRDEWYSVVADQTSADKFAWVRATRRSIHRYKKNFRAPKVWK